MTKNKQKLELTWIGKGQEKPLEPRILVENPEKSYGDPDTENMLIHGDNLLALKALEQNYTGKIKCIYIDPPYNTGSAFEHYDDGLQHSIWLQLMYRRLELLQLLLKDDGIIFVSIDDHEVAYLQVIMDEIFGRSNFICNACTIMNLKGNQDQFGFAGTHEYTLIYAKNKNKVKLNKFKVDEETIAQEWLEDYIGLYKKGATLKSTGEESKREDRPKMFYPILVKNGKIESITTEEYKSLYTIENNIFNDDILSSIVTKYKEQGFDVILPFKSPHEYGRWRWGFDTFKASYKTEILVTEGRNGISLYKKQRPEIGEIPTAKPKSFFYKPEYSSGNGTAQIKSLFGYNAFPYPKPEDLISDIITIGSSKGDIVLDSFLGSGTTAAVAHKMGRKWIGIELGDHCYTLCEPRLQKVVDGTDQGGISKALNWKGGGGYKFYELAPSLLKKDEFGNWIIDSRYDAEMLAEAMAKQEGYQFSPDEENIYKQGYSTEKDFIFTTTQFLSIELLDKIYSKLKADESLLICATHFEEGTGGRYDNITVKKIPQMLLNRCEFGKLEYNLNIIDPPQETEDDEEILEEE